MVFAAAEISLFFFGLLICTHPGENATCTQEGAVATPSTSTTPTPTPISTPVKLTCEQCFTKFLTQQQIGTIGEGDSLAQLCELVEQVGIAEAGFRLDLTAAGVSETTANEVIACLKDAGIVFFR